MSAVRNRLVGGNFNAIPDATFATEFLVSFIEQILNTVDKAAARIFMIRRLMSNVGGPSSSRRHLLMTAVQ